MRFNKITSAIVLLLLLCFFACDNREIRENKYTNGGLFEQYEVIKDKNNSYIKDGFYNQWDKKGVLILEGEYKKGKKENEWQGWYNEDNISYEKVYSQGYLNGPFKTWYPNGQVREEGNFKNDKLDGKYKTWHSNGQLQMEGNCKNGKLDGKIKMWYENGNINVEGNFDNGERIETYKKFFEDKQIKFERIYNIKCERIYNKGDKKGKIISVKQWDKFGKLYINTKFDEANKNLTLLDGIWQQPDGSFIQFNADNTNNTMDKNKALLGKGEYEVILDNNTEEDLPIKIVFNKKDTYIVNFISNDSLIVTKKYGQKIILVKK